MRRLLFVVGARGLVAVRVGIGAIAFPPGGILPVRVTAPIQPPTTLSDDLFVVMKSGDLERGAGLAVALVPTSP